MFLYLNEEQVASLVTMREAINLLEKAFKSWHAGRAINEPRRRLRYPGGALHWLSAALPAAGYFGYKAYTTAAGKARFFFHLFDAASGQLLSMMEADHLGQIRTGAASGLATRLLARAGARTAAIIGSGWQARSQLEAIASVRDFSEVRVWSRQPDNVASFIETMSMAGAPLRSAASAREAVEGAEVICTATFAGEPVLRVEWVEAGCHINATGSNGLTRRELPTALLTRADLLVVDSRRQAALEAGDFLEGIERGLLHLDRMRELAEIVADPSCGRVDARQITVFKSLGLALEDLAVGIFVYEKARAQGIGAEFGGK